MSKGWRPGDALARGVRRPGTLRRLVALVSLVAAVAATGCSGDDPASQARRSPAPPPAPQLATTSPVAAPGPSTDGITQEADRKIPPPPPTIFAVTTLASRDGVQVSWGYGTGGGLIQSCNVYRREGDRAPMRIGSVRVDPSGPGTVSFVDRDAQAKVAYSYLVSAVDAYGNESALSDPKTIGG